MLTVEQLSKSKWAKCKTGEAFDAHSASLVAVSLTRSKCSVPFYAKQESEI